MCGQPVAAENARSLSETVVLVDDEIRRRRLRYQRDADGVRRLDVILRDDGSLVIDGQDLGRGVESFWGEGLTEYEWTRTIEKEHVPQLVAALGGGPGADVLALIEESFAGDKAAGLEQLLEQAAIPFKSWSRVGD
jgi:hypothetical protein